VRAPVIGPTVIAPVVPTAGRLRPLGIDRVVLAPDSFWGQRQRLVSSTTLAHIRVWLERMGWLHNFETNGRDASSRGSEFSDSEVYKYLEALVWDGSRTGSAETEAEIERVTTLLESRQAADGYLNTAFGVPGQAPRYSDLAFGHELYCAGHLLQACVARLRTRDATDRLVRVGIRVADHLVATFLDSGAPGAGICGHPEVEMALVEFGRALGNETYLRLAATLIDRRGHNSFPRSYRAPEYFSDAVPVRAATVFAGHAVRALYLAAGATDVAVENDDDDLMDAVARQWRATQDRRTYITGGMGSQHLDEAFGEDFMLPPDRAYSETCAGIASAMLSWRLLLATGDTRYADAIERVLFNVVATGFGVDGASFFYANTLHQRTVTRPAFSDTAQLDFGGRTVRAPWYDVSCCLTNLARTIPALATYVASQTSSGIQLHQYFPSTVSALLDDGGSVRLSIGGDYPAGGEITVTIEEAPTTAWTLSLRIPAWAGGARLSSAGVDERIVGGVADITRVFLPGDEVRLSLPMHPRWVRPDSRIDAVRGAVAALSGPLVLCAELLEGSELRHDGFRVLPIAAPEPVDAGARARVRRVEFSPAGLATDAGEFDLDLTPYHSWANRGPSTMRVWLPILEANR
jgi:DUF1680 family protein